MARRQQRFPNQFSRFSKLTTAINMNNLVDLNLDCIKLPRKFFAHLAQLIIQSQNASRGSGKPSFRLQKSKRRVRSCK